MPARDAALEVTPGMYDLDNVLVTGISVRAPVNTLPIGVALGTNGLPPVYAKASKEQISRMITELGLPQRAEHLIVHIPANQTVPDTQIIHHLLKGFFPRFCVCLTLNFAPLGKKRKCHVLSRRRVVQDVWRSDGCSSVSRPDSAVSRPGQNVWSVSSACLARRNAAPRRPKQDHHQFLGGRANGSRLVAHFVVSPYHH